MLPEPYSLLGLFDMASFNQDPLAQLSVTAPSVTVPVIASSVDSASTDTNTALVTSDGTEYTLKLPIDASYNQVIPKWRRDNRIVGTESYR